MYPCLFHVVHYEPLMMLETNCAILPLIAAPGRDLSRPIMLSLSSRLVSYSSHGVFPTDLPIDAQHSPRNDHLYLGTQCDAQHNGANGK
jgi:hypothetical protein